MNSNPIIPRSEYPRPTLVRKRWLCLNGTWDFAMDPADLGLRDGWQHRDSLPQRITVPFCVEAEASGIGDRTPADILWYHRTFECPAGWADDRLLLHFGASDQATRVFINGQEVGQNEGGYAPFAFDIAHCIRAGFNHISVRVQDSASWSQPRGKQEGTTRWPIDYDGVTGLWQTVWLEPLPTRSISDCFSTFVLSTQTLRFTVGLSGLFSGQLDVRVRHNGNLLADGQCGLDQRSEAKLTLSLPSNNLPLWSPDSPQLCELTLRLHDPQGQLIDEAESYLGLREITIVDGQIQLNNAPLYIRGVLDQGYFPEGWYTARHDDDFRRDIELTKALGFNCARKHQKAEDPRYLYWADRLGLLVWAEMPSGRIFSSDFVQSLTNEWLRLVRRDRAHPCVIAWVPFNESWGVWNQVDRPEQRALVDALVSLTRALDTSRLVIGNDGWEYSSGDLWTLHLYEGDAIPLADRLTEVLANPQALLQQDGRVGALAGANVDGLPVLLTECGGVGYQLGESAADVTEEVFAYGDLPTTTAELERRIRGVAKDVHHARALQGFVWTQLTDVQQEMNGLLSFERKPKLPLSVLRAIFQSIGAN